MATVINNPTPVTAGERDSSAGTFLGIVLLLILAVLFFVYALPYVGNVVSQSTTPQVNVPGQVDVNVHNTK